MNKKGWIRIVEASIAIILIATVMIIINQSQKPVKSDAEITSLENRILDEMVGDNLMRQNIINYDTTQLPTDAVNAPLIGNLSLFVASRVPVGVNSTVRVCDVNDICNLDGYIPEIYARERIVSSTLSKYGPKKVKMFIWLK